MKTINPSNQLIILLLILTTIATSCLWLLPRGSWLSAAQAQSMTAQLHLSPTASYFTSPATNQGVRRFLAIGNFYDTTNSAYFYDSKSFLSFDVPELRIASGKLVIYKYAHGGTNPAQLSLVKAGVSLASTTASVGNYDYTPLEFVIDKQHLSSGINTFEIIETTQQFRAGIAVCSGNSFDSVCPENYRPRFEVTYLTNELGQLEELKTTSLRKLGITAGDEYVLCIEVAVCRLKVSYSYTDPDENSLFRLEASGVSTDWRSDNAGDLEIDLVSGQHEVRFVVNDGGESILTDIGRFDVGLKRPAPPEILYADEVSSRSGIRFILSEQEDVVSFRLQMCAGIVEPTGAPQPLSSATFLAVPTASSASAASATSPQAVCEQVELDEDFDSTQLRLQFAQVYQPDKKYFYRFTAADSYGNISLPRWSSAVHKPDLEQIKGVTLDRVKISPRNLDGKYDSLTANLPPLPNLKLRIYNSRFEQIGQKAGPAAEESKQVITGRDADGKFLSSGRYYLQVAGFDAEGYSYIPSDLLRIEIDNIPPKIW